MGASNLLLAIALILIVFIAVFVAPRPAIGARTPPTLGDDSWPTFEREFRAYASRVADGRLGEEQRRSDDQS